jgi:hypothetical protein
MRLETGPLPLSETYMRLFAIAILSLMLFMAGAAMMAEDTAARAGHIQATNAE